MADVLSTILKYRDLHKLNNAQLAEKLGVSRSTPGKWETGEGYPRRTDFAKFAKAMGMTLAELTSDTSYENLTQERKAHMTVEESEPKRLVPFFDAVVVGGLSVLADQAPVSQPVEMIDPGTFLRQATGTLRVYGDSMFPKYPGGSVVAFRPANEAVIIWGEDYVLELSDRRMVKRLEKSEFKDHVKAVSYNINKDGKYVYDPVDIPRKEIKRLFMVLGRVVIEASI